MPNYGFCCTKCSQKFDRFLTISNREAPLTESCESCGKKSIIRDYDNQTSSLTSDSLNTPNKKTGGDWNELMKKLKPGLPKYTHANLDNATNRSCRRWN
jgi:putative FmdB family regulatory protein